MTTHYTSVVGITTPSVTLSDFTSVVPANLGVNVYGGALDADINTFDVGPTGDSNILLQTHQVGSHHVHDGVLHNSADGTVPPYGVHGLYDKAFDTLVETVEFHHHPNGQGYSPRYGNRCKSCVFHDTPYLIGLFNYQGAAIGPTGQLRIRDAIGYNIPAGGYVFFSDGVWKESDGTVLGDSTISVELDHCTFDVRGVTDPFNFSDCHNDVYLTNCIIISDSGLPLSSIIVPPSDSSTVHLDGSIVLSSADAATYLGPAPTFTPIAVGGSPVIGTAVASSPGCYAAWGNEGDVGATQTGSSPPPPPPLPGPATPDITYTVIGSVDSSGTATVVIPITADVPRSSPSGATLIMIFIQSDPTTLAGISSAVDDATPEDAYSLCIFADGLNHYRTNINPAIGLIVNDLVGGVNTITLTLTTPPLAFHATAIAVTGVQFTGSPPFDPTLPAITGIFQEAQWPAGTGTSTHNGVAWNTNADSSVTMTEPPGATDATWGWALGTVAFYEVVFADPTGASDPLGWNWSDASIADLDQWDIADGVTGYMGTAIGVQNPVTPGADGPSVVGFKQNGDPNEFGYGGVGFALIPGPGPLPCAPPPTPGTPVFNTRFRAGV